MRGRRGPGGEVEAGCELLQLGDVDEVVGLLGVAAGHAVPVVGGDARLEVHHALRPLGRLVEAGQLEHRGDVADVGLADGGEVVVGVVRLVGQAETVLREVGDVAVGLPAVGGDEQAEDAADAHALERAEGAHERRDVGDRLDLAELVGQRLRAECLDAVLVHEAGVEVADLAFLTCWIVGRMVAAGLDDRSHLLLGLVEQRHEGAGGGAVGRDVGGAQPRPVDVPEQVVLDADVGIETRDVDGGLRGRGIG